MFGPPLCHLDQWLIIYWPKKNNFRHCQELSNVLFLRVLKHDLFDRSGMIHDQSTSTCPIRVWLIIDWGLYDMTKYGYILSGITHIFGIPLENVILTLWYHPSLFGLPVIFFLLLTSRKGAGLILTWNMGGDMPLYGCTPASWVFGMNKTDHTLLLISSSCSTSGTRSITLFILFKCSKIIVNIWNINSPSTFFGFDFRSNVFSHITQLVLIDALKFL